jgi:hypothetical protein
MREKLRITDETDVQFTPTDLEDVDLEDLSFVADIECEGEDVVNCEIDLARLIDVMTVYSSLEQQRYDWR